MKKSLKLLIMLFISFSLTGCFKSEELDNADIYTTVYPIQFITEELYGYNSDIKSIYPDGINIKEYELSNKKIRKYSKEDLFVYNGLTDEKKIAASFVNNNSKLKIIDVTEGMAIKTSQEELWLNPTNYLMVAQNIKNGLKQYINSTIIKEEIDANYETLKVIISEFETTLKLLAQNGQNNTLLVSKDYLTFLNNYGFDVISLEENENLNNDKINKAKSLITEKKIKYIFVTDEETKSSKYSNTIEEIKNAGAEIKTLNTITILTSEQKEKSENYVTLMKENIELIKEEIYKEQK